MSVRDHYSGLFSAEMDGISFRFFVLLALLVYGLAQLTLFSAEYDSDIIEHVAGINTAFSIIGVLLGFFLIRMFWRLLLFAAIAKYGHRRLWAVAGLFPVLLLWQGVFDSSVGSDVIMFAVALGGILYLETFLHGVIGDGRIGDWLSNRNGPTTMHDIMEGKR